MLPILLFMYTRLARTEEAEMRARFGQVFIRYQKTAPRFLPRIFHSTCVD